METEKAEKEERRTQKNKQDVLLSQCMLGLNMYVLAIDKGKTFLIFKILCYAYLLIVTYHLPDIFQKLEKIQETQVRKCYIFKHK